KSAYPQDILVADSDPKKIQALRKDIAVRVAKNNRHAASLADVLILAVKPQVLRQVIEEVASVTDKKTLVISVAAGVTIAKIESYFKKTLGVIRVMPNMPALVGSGMSAFSLGRHAEAKHRRIAETILSATGESAQVQEKLLDLVTAVSGSGPAYYFLLTEKLIEAAYELGMKIDVAKKFVYQTAYGSAKVLMESQEDPEVLIERVASKRGTTEAALGVFRQKGFGRIVRDAVHAALKRSIELRETK
ncbi:MAG: pyrroline-5-carboxylate reductase, partial [Candidatus Omnitrophota bacterium]